MKTQLGPAACCQTCGQSGDALCVRCLHWFCRAHWGEHVRAICEWRHLEKDGDPKPPEAA